LKERAKAEKINRKLRQQLADFRVPEVMEYVTEKADLYELQKKVKSWERKVEIAEVSDCFIKTFKGNDYFKVLSLIGSLGFRTM
jgi:hypothetical protein